MKKPTPDTILENINCALRAQGLTKTALGYMLGYSEPEISALLLGKRSLKMYDFLLIARALKLPPALLLSEDFRHLYD